ncbi:hypothetical protein WJX82_004090 [Trebouxia sp. C0006]
MVRLAVPRISNGRFRPKHLRAALQSSSFCLVFPQARQHPADRASQTSLSRLAKCCGQSLLVVFKVTGEMNKFNVAVFFVAMLIVGACAAPRKLLISSETQEMADAIEHQRLLEELETVQALRDRMLAEAATYEVVSTTVGAPAPAPL